MGAVRPSTRRRSAARKGRRPSDVDRAYMAGILDGEGYIGVAVRRSSYTVYVPEVSITMTDSEALSLFRSYYGGAWYIRDDQRGDTKRRLQLRFAVSCERAALLLQEVLPFLRVKRRQALLGLRLQAWRERRKARRVVRRFNRNVTRQYSQSERRFLERVHAQSKSLNQRVRLKRGA